MLFYIGDCFSAKDPAIYDPKYGYNEGFCDHLMRHYDDYFIQGSKDEAQINGINFETASFIVIVLLP